MPKLVDRDIENLVIEMATTYPSLSYKAISERLFRIGCKVPSGVARGVFRRNDLTTSHKRLLVAEDNFRLKGQKPSRELEKKLSRKKQILNDTDILFPVERDEVVAFGTTNYRLAGNRTIYLHTILDLYSFEGFVYPTSYKTSYFLMQALEKYLGMQKITGRKYPNYIMTSNSPTITGNSEDSFFRFFTSKHEIQHAIANPNNTKALTLVKEYAIDLKEIMDASIECVNDSAPKGDFVLKDLYNLLDGYAMAQNEVWKTKVIEGPLWEEC